MAKRDGLYRRGRIWWIRTDPLDGVPRSTGCTDFEAARIWRSTRERLAADPAHAAATQATLGDWIGRVVAMKERTSSVATAQVYRQKLGHFLRVWGADLSLAAIGPELTDSYVSQRRGETVSDHTISKEVTHLCYLLRLAKRSKSYAGDIESIRPPDLHAGYVPRKRALTRHEVVRLLAALEPERAALVAVCIALGCRRSEAFKLLPSDVDIKAQRVFVRGTKTEESLRSVPVLSLFRPLLDAALPYLPLQPWENLSRDLNRACERAGILPCTPNDLRRTHATLLQEAGVDRDVIRRLLGHTTTALVDRVYGQARPEALADLAEARLVSAQPIITLHVRDAEVVPIADPGATLGIRTPDLRFTKPRTGSAKDAGSNDVRRLATTADGGERYRPGVVRAGTLQCAARLSLGYAALRVGALSNRTRAAGGRL